MALCERCGSIHVVRATSSVLDKAISLVTWRKPFVCRRCGWRARRAWDENVKIDRSNMALDPAAAYDPALAVLDEERRSASQLKSRRKWKGGSEKQKAKTQAAPVADEFELPALSELDAAAPLDRDISTNRVRKSGKRKFDRMRRGRRREIIGAVAIAAGVMFIIVMLGLSGSCGGRP